MRKTETIAKNGVYIFILDMTRCTPERRGSRGGMQRECRVTRLRMLPAVATCLYLHLTYGVNAAPYRAAKV